MSQVRTEWLEAWLALIPDQAESKPMTFNSVSATPLLNNSVQITRSQAVTRYGIRHTLERKRFSNSASLLVDNFVCNNSFSKRS